MSEQESLALDRQEGRTGETRRIGFLGFLTLLTITAAAILHVNQPEFILDRFVGISELEYSLFDTTLYLSYLTVGITVGALSDLWAKRRAFVFVGTAGSVLFYFLMTTALVYPLLLVYRFIQGAFTVMAWQTFMTLAIDFSGERSRGKNMGLFGAFLATAMGLGPALGGVIASYGVFMPYYVASGLNIAAFILALAGLKEPEFTKARPELRESLDIVRTHPRLVVPGLFNMVDRLHIGFILTALPLFLSTVLGLSESLRGLSLAIFATPFIILQYPMGKLSDKYGRYRPLVVGSISYGIILTLLGAVGVLGFESLLLMLALLGLFSGVTAPPAMALVGDTVEQKDSAMGMGFFNLMGNIGITIGPLVFGILTIFTDFVGVFVVAGLLEILALLVIIIIIRKGLGEKLV
ncbi:MAG: MFS transporter [Candidatus Thorarchaeota archaeon]|nr:MAG: MFS transporter [Candidatus Thorarchaeota archaeon]